MQDLTPRPGLQRGFAPLAIVSTSAREFWSPTLLKRVLGFIAADDRPGAPAGNVFWPGDQGQVKHHRLLAIKQRHDPPRAA